MPNDEQHIERLPGTPEQIGVPLKQKHSQWIVVLVVIAIVAGGLWYLISQFTVDPILEVDIPAVEVSPAISPPSAIPVDTSDWVTATSIKSNFSIQVPPDMSADLDIVVGDEPSRGIPLMNTFSKDSNAFILHVVRWTELPEPVWEEILGKKGVTFQDYVDQDLEIKGLLGTETHVSIGGEDARMIRYTNNNNKSVNEVYVEHEGIMYQISAWADEASYDMLFDQILGSIRFVFFDKRYQDANLWGTFQDDITSMSISYPERYKPVIMAAAAEDVVKDVVVINYESDLALSISYIENPNNVSLRALNDSIAINGDGYGSQSSGLYADSYKVTLVGRDMIAYIQSDYQCGASICTRYIVPTQNRVFTITLFPPPPGMQSYEQSIDAILSTFMVEAEL